MRFLKVIGKLSIVSLGAAAMAGAALGQEASNQECEKSSAKNNDSCCAATAECEEAKAACANTSKECSQDTKNVLIGNNGQIWFTSAEPKAAAERQPIAIRRSLTQQAPQQSQQLFRVKKRDGSNDGPHQETRIQLNINGKEYDVDSMEEAHEILQKLGHSFDFDFKNMHKGDIQFGGEHGLDLSGTHGNVFKWEHDDDDKALFGEVEDHQRVMIGIHMDQVEPAIRQYLDLPGEEGVLITAVVPDTPAAWAGLKGDDIIIGVGFDGHNDACTFDSLRETMEDLEPGDFVRLEVIRQGKRIVKELEVAPWNAEALGVFEMDNDDNGFEWNDEDGMRVFVEPGDGQDMQFFNLEGMEGFENMQLPEEALKHLRELGLEGIEFHKRDGGDDPHQEMRRIEIRPGENGEFHFNHEGMDEEGMHRLMEQLRDRIQHQGDRNHMEHDGDRHDQMHEQSHDRPAHPERRARPDGDPMHDMMRRMEEQMREFEERIRDMHRQHRELLEQMERTRRELHEKVDA